MEKYLRHPAPQLTRFNPVMGLIEAIILTTALVFPLGQLLRFSSSRPEASFHALDFLSLLTIPLSVKILRSRQPKPDRSSLMAPFSLFLISLLLSWLIHLPNLNLKEASIGLFYFIRLLSLTSLFICARHFSQVIPPGKITSRLPGILILSTATLGILQYVFFPDLRPLEVLGWDPHLYRVVGTFLDPGFTGLILAFGLIISLTRHHQTNSSIAKGFRAIIFAIIYISFLLTYSRASYLAFLAGIWVWGIYDRRYNRSVIITLFLVISILVLPRKDSIGTQLDRQDSIKARIENWKISLSVFASSPILGSGFNTYRYTLINRYPDQINLINSHSGAGGDSSLLFTLATSGIVGFSFLIWFIVRLFRFFANRMQSTNLSLLTALVIHSFFQNSLYYPWVLVFLIFQVTLAPKD